MSCFQKQMFCFVEKEEPLEGMSEELNRFYDGGGSSEESNGEGGE